MARKVRAKTDRAAGGTKPPPARPQAPNTPITEVVWSPAGNPAQQALLACEVFEVFFGGARGGGKTDGMLGDWINHADRYGRDANALMIRRTRAELVDTVERSKVLFSPLGWKYN